MGTLDDLLRARGRYVTCPSCGESFPARRARLFDAKKPLPGYVVAHLTEARTTLAEDRRKLRAQRKDLRRRSFTSAATSGIGQTLETLTPSLSGFPAVAQDRRVLLKPLDYVAFEGASRGRVSAITFIEVKTGQQRLSVEQRATKAAIEGGALSLQVADHSVPTE